MMLLTLSTTQSLVFKLYGSFGEVVALVWSSSNLFFLMESQEKFWSFLLSVFDRFECDPEEQLTDRVLGRLVLFLVVNYLSVVNVFIIRNVPFVHLSIHLNLRSQFANVWRSSLRCSTTYLKLTGLNIGHFTCCNLLKFDSKSAEIRSLCWNLWERFIMAVSQERLIFFLNFSSWVSFVKVTPRPA